MSTSRASLDGDPEIAMSAALHPQLGRKGDENNDGAAWIRCGCKRRDGDNENEGKNALLD